MFKSKSASSQRSKKKPPPRPPPPDFTKLKSKSTVNLVQHLPDTLDLIDLSPTNSPQVDTRRPFCGSVSSSFSSSTSSLASSKKSSDYDTSPFNSNSWFTSNTTSSNSTYVHSNIKPTNNASANNSSSTNHNLKVNGNTLMPSLFGPTIIRAAPPKITSRHKAGCSTSPLSHSPTPPMPSIPPPSPPKEATDVITPYGVALFDFPAAYPSDLPLQVDDIVILHRRVNEEWLYGQVGDKEGMFPSNFVDIIVHLPGEDKIVTALYEFEPQMPGDLRLIPDQKINVIKKISDEWLYGESNGNVGI